MAIQQTANDLDQIRRSSPPSLVVVDHKTLCILLGNELRVRIYKWLSPPDPSTNHTIACDTHHKKVATWFFQDRIYQEWKSEGSLLWIHGKRSSCSTSHLVPPDRFVKS